MKIKELKRTVNVSWSPAEQYPIMLAAGTAAQQVDASFSSSSCLELYSLNLEEPGMDLELKSSLQTQHKFQKLVWSGAGVVVGGCDGGLLQFYNAEKLLASSTEALVGSSSKHSGHVSALDINPYQKNLLASGASESEIFIWDLNNTSQPMSPGNRNQPYDHVQGLAWNQQVQHILGSTFANRCVVWDLRKNEPIMKLSDAQSRTRWRSLAWHPAVATQLCIASEDDQVPVIQLWDLRLAASPLVTLEGHDKGVLALSWCRQDPDLLLSAGKDGRLLAWNPNNTKPGGELVVEVCQEAAWTFDVSWCPRSPALLSSSSLEQQVAVHALLAAPQLQPSAHKQSSMLESFGVAGSLGALPSVCRAPAQPPPQPARAPAWLRRPRAAHFAFGGKLVTFDRCPQEAGPQKTVYISQVVSEPELVEQAAALDGVLGLTLSRDPGAADQLAEYCRQRGEAAADQQERYVWFFLRASFLPTFRTEVLNLLGFKQDEIPAKFKSTATGDAPHNLALSRGESTETEAELSTDTSTDLSDAHTLIERKLANLDLSPAVANVVIPNGDDSTSMICRALVCGNVEEAVELCLEAHRVADALVIAALGGEELVRKVQQYHVAGSREPVALLAGALLGARWPALLAAAPASWRHALAALLTHAGDDDLVHYCEMLGAKLSQESDPELQSAAVLCYVCAARADKLPAAARPGPQHTAQHAAQPRAQPAALVRRAELALLLRCAAETRGREQKEDATSSSLQEYALRLAEQGCLQSALAALRGAPSALADRLQYALGLQQHQQQQHQQQQQHARARTLSAHSAHSAHSQRTHQQHQQHLPHQTHPYNPHAHISHNDIANAFGSGVPLASDAGSWQAQQPRPPSAGPHQPHTGITSRSKYKVDPSVQAPGYGQYGYNPVTSQPQAYAGYNSPPPDPAALYRTPANTINPINPAPLNPINAHNAAPLNPLIPAPMNPLNPAQINSLNQPMNPLNNPLMNPLNPLLPTANGGYGMEPAAPPAPVAPPAPPRSAAPGWNDPPMMASKPKPKQEVAAQAPITHPLFGAEPPQHVPLHPQAFAPAPAAAPAPAPAPGYYPDQHYQQQYAPPVYNQQEAAPPPAAPLQKAPLPEQYAELQAVFDSLRADCAQRPPSTQMKRKLDDVQRRLETLYDLLREYRLSEGAVGMLRQCAQHARGGEFPQALQCATALASGADFAAAAAFLPGLKLLLQLAPQLLPHQHQQLQQR